jgi:RNA polymerase sigma-70 factor (ECF subfamily)
MDQNARSSKFGGSIPLAAERQLIDRAIGGDREALDRLLRHYYQPLIDHITHKVPSWLQNVIEAKDIAQETIQQAIRHVGSFESRPGGGFFAWLKTIAQNKLTDRCRKVGLEPTAAENSWLDGLPRLISAINPSPSRQAARREVIEAMQMALVHLPPRQQTAIHLQYVEQISVREIATVMNCTENAVRGLLHHAKAKLRVALGRSSKWLSRN